MKLKQYFIALSMVEQIKLLKNENPNDQDLGREIRKYLNKIENNLDDNNLNSDEVYNNWARQNGRQEIKNER